MTNIVHAISSLPGILVACGVIGFVTVWCLVPLLISRSASFLARAQGREFHQTHTAPVPRFGGIALVAAFLVVTLVSLLVEKWQPGGPRTIIALTSLAMFALGLRDDISPLGARKKLLGQILIAVAAFYFGLK